ncbi:TPA: WYL domain-containing protein [Klebsiella oxytoca]
MRWVAGQTDAELAQDAQQVLGKVAAVREERKVAIGYRDGNGSPCVIWPFALGFFERERVVAAWCECRRDLRHFRVDRLLPAPKFSTGKQVRKAQRSKVRHLSISCPDSRTQDQSRGDATPSYPLRRAPSKP